MWEDVVIHSHLYKYIEIDIYSIGKSYSLYQELIYSQSACFLHSHSIYLAIE